MKCFGEKIRNYHCKVVLLDDQELIQEIQSTSLGQELLETIFKHLNVIETSYFGLRYIDNTGQTHWLDSGKKIIQQLDGTESFTLYFGVKFYAVDPCKLVEEITRYQFFLQIKQDILQGRLPVPNDLTAELCAYAVQSDLGDYDSRRHCAGYISEFQFTSNQSIELETNIAEIHKSMLGEVPAVSELNYLEKVKWLEMYGVDLHPVLGEDNTDYFLGLTPSGVIVLRNKTKVGNYFWPRISKLNQKGKYFMLRVKNKNNEEQTYGFETPTKSACKHLWRCATEHHAFFRLVQVAPTAKSHSLNTRFRDSARSDTSVRRRAQPQFVRTPSRRYQRRVVEGAQDGDSEIIKNDTLKDQNEVGNYFKKTVAVPQQVDVGGTYSVQSLSTVPNRSDSPRSTKSAPWPGVNSLRTRHQSSVPSPKSARSAGVGSTQVQQSERTSDRHHHRSRKRSESGESNSSCDSRSQKRHRHRRSRKSSDGESEVSRASGKSHHGKRRHHKSGSTSRHRESGSESENCSQKHKHRHRKCSQNTKYELVDSEAQWKEVQKMQAQVAVQQAAVVPNVGNIQNGFTSSNTNNSSITTTPIRKSGYMNSGIETESSEVSYHQNRRKHRRNSHRSSSPDKRLSSELKRHLDFKLIDTDGMTEEQRRQIPYLNVETSQDKTLKSGRIRHNSSIKSNKSSSLVQNNFINVTRDNNKLINQNSEPKIEFGNSTGDSPPPPYSASGVSVSQNIESKPPVAQKPVISSLSTSLVNQMTHIKPMDWSRDLLTGNSSRNQCQELSPKIPAGQVKQRFHQYILPTDVNSVNRSKQSHDSKRNHQELGLPVILHPSPSESPDSQKVDSHHENSDSGLGTDHHEYYKSESFSSLGYEVSQRNQSDSTKRFNNIGSQNGDRTKSLRQVISPRTNSSNMYLNQQNYWSNITGNVPQIQQSSDNGTISSKIKLKTSRTEEKLNQGLFHQPPEINHELSTEL